MKLRFEFSNEKETTNFTSFRKQTSMFLFRPTLYNGHLQGPVTLTPVAEPLAVEQSLPVFTTWVCCDRGSKPDLPHANRMLYLYAPRSGQVIKKGHSVHIYVYTEDV